MQVTNLIKEYQSLNLSQYIDFDKFKRYSITHHSTSLEGSTLTQIETNLLLDENITPNGKPLLHSLMTIDHEKALFYIIEQAKLKTLISTEFIKEINAEVMARTGSMYETVFGIIDGSKGMFRKGNVVAGSRYFPNFDKVETLTQNLSATLAYKINSTTNVLDQLLLSFDAHFDLVSIHPFYDGNGRTSRLLMNYVQLYYNLPVGIVFKEDKVEYITALEETRNKENLKPFRDFMMNQYIKFLTLEIKNYNEMKKDKGSGFSMIF